MEGCPNNKEMWFCEEKKGAHSFKTNIISADCNEIDFERGGFVWRGLPCLFLTLEQNMLPVLDHSSALLICVNTYVLYKCLVVKMKQMRRVPSIVLSIKQPICVYVDVNAVSLKLKFRCYKQTLNILWSQYEVGSDSNIQGVFFKSSPLIC